LPHDVDGRKEDQPNRSDLYFKRGPHHLNGQQALMLARLREHTVFERADQQNRVLCALRDAILTPQNLTNLPQIVDAFDDAIQTDLSPQQISQLACLAPQIEPQNIRFVSFPTDLLTGTRTYDIGVDKEVFIWDADFNILRTYVAAFSNGSWPAVIPNLPAIPGTPSAPAEPPFSCP
jgi:anionic cell wall polymer biosynthesis LytR-Cps2A-Psr (LCP) family protein